MASGLSVIGGGFWDGIINYLADGVVAPILNFFNTYLAYIIGLILYGLQIGLFYIIDAIQMVFRRVAGLDVYYSNGVEQEGDIVFSLLQDPTVQATFISILVAGVFLLFITTFIAVLKTEFDEKDNAKAPVFKSALKAIAYFAIVPIVCMLGIYVSNVVLKMLDGATSRDAESFSSSIFTAAAYDANRARQDADFAKYCYNNHKWIPGMNNLAAYDQERVASLIDQAFRGNYVPVVADSGTNTSAPALATGDGVQNYEIMYNGTKLASASVVINRGLTSGTLTFSTFSQTNYELVYYFYNPLSYNYIIGWVASIAIAGILLNLLLGVIMRIFELCILFVLSPAAVALMPLDGGDRYKSWRGMFVKRVFSAYGPILGLNLVFMVLTLIKNIQFFPPGGVGGLYNSLIYIVIMFAALASIRSLVDLVTELVGQGDALKQGQSMAKDTKALATKTIGQVGNVAAIPARATYNAIARGVNSHNNRKAQEKLYFDKETGKLTSKYEKDDKGNYIRDANGNPVLNQNAEVGSSSRMYGTRIRGALAGLTEEGRANSKSYEEAQKFKTRRAETEKYLKSHNGMVTDQDKNGKPIQKHYGQYSEGAGVGGSLKNLWGSYVDDKKGEEFAKGFGKGAPIMGSIAGAYKKKGEAKEYDDMKKKAKAERKIAGELNREESIGHDNGDYSLYAAAPPSIAPAPAGSGGGAGGTPPAGASGTPAAGSPTFTGAGVAGFTPGSTTNNSSSSQTVAGGTPSTMNGAAPVTVQNTPTVKLAGDNDNETPDLQVSAENNEGSFELNEVNSDTPTVSVDANNVDEDTNNTEIDTDKEETDAGKTEVDAGEATTKADGDAKMKIDDAKITEALSQVKAATNNTKESIVNALNKLSKEVQKNADASRDTASVIKGIAKTVGKISNDTGSKTRSGKNKRS